MFKDDRIYQVLLKYDFDLFRGKKSITEYIAEHIAEYYAEIVSATEGKNDFLGPYFVALLKEKLPIIKELGDEIPAILSAFDNGHIRDAYNRSALLFDKVEPYLLAYKRTIQAYRGT